MNGPTVFRTLMDEALDEARDQARTTMVDGLSDVLHNHVSPAELVIVSQATRRALEQAYLTGLQHGYHQATQEFDQRGGQA